MRIIHHFVCTSLFLISCGSKTTTEPAPDPSSSDQEIKTIPAYVDTPISGKIAGKDWKMVAGVAKRSSTGRLHIDLYDRAFNDDAFANGDICKQFSPFFANTLMTSLEKETGIGEILFRGTGSTATVYDTDSKHNYATDEVKIKISRIDTELHASFSMFYDKDNQVNGTFKIKICEN